MKWLKRFSGALFFVLVYWSLYLCLYFFPVLVFVFDTCICFVGPCIPLLKCDEGHSSAQVHHHITKTTSCTNLAALDTSLTRFFFVKHLFTTKCTNLAAVETTLTTIIIPEKTF